MSRASKLRVRFRGGAGATLVGVLEQPADQPRAFALFAPCFTCPKDAKAIVRVSEGLASAGIAVLRYDVTGSGHSGGDFARTSFSSQVEDLVAAAEYLRAEHRPPSLAMGISLGGAVVLSGARRIPELEAVATLNAPADTIHLHELLLRLAPDVLETGEAEIEVLGRSIRIGRRLVEDLPRHDIEAAARGLGLPLMIFHAPEDEIVSIKSAQRLLDVALHPKSLVAVDRSDHLLLRNRAAPGVVARILAAWLEQYLR